MDLIRSLAVAGDLGVWVAVVYLALIRADLLRTKADVRDHEKRLRRVENPRGVIL